MCLEVVTLETPGDGGAVVAQRCAVAAGEKSGAPAAASRRLAAADQEYASVELAERRADFPVDLII